MVIAGDWVNGKTIPYKVREDGTYDFINPLGDRVKETWKGGKLQGKRLEYHKNGKIRKKEFFIDSEYHKRRIIYFSNGRKDMLQTWKKGQLHGVSKRWNNNGKLVSREVWSEGVKIK